MMSSRNICCRRGAALPLAFASHLPNECGDANQRYSTVSSSKYTLTIHTHSRVDLVVALFWFASNSQVSLHWPRRLLVDFVAFGSTFNFLCTWRLIFVAFDVHVLVHLAYYLVQLFVVACVFCFLIVVLGVCVWLCLLFLRLRCVCCCG